MGLTGQLGASDSSLGNFALGLLSEDGINRSASDLLSFVESNDHNFIFVSGSDALTFSEVDVIYVPIRRTGTDTINFTETVTVNARRARGATDVFALDELNRKSVSYALSASDTLVFTEGQVFSRFIYSENESLVLTETNAFVRVHNLTAVDAISFSEQNSRPSVLNREATESLMFVGGTTKRFGNGSLIVSYPESLAIKVENLFVLKGFAAAITLPNPDFDDSIANTDILTVYRSMTNEIYTYVKRNDLSTLSYTFQLTRKKSIELRRFFDRERNNKIQIRNHKSEVWEGFLITNPINYTAVKRAEPAGEQIEVTFDFEAVRII